MCDRPDANPNIQSRIWSFTINNWTEEDATRCRDDLDKLCLDLVIGSEVASTGTRHLQGCCRLRKPCRASAMRRLLPGAHVEVTRNHAASMLYCRKDRSCLIDRETATAQGKRTDLDGMVAVMKEGGLTLLKDRMPHMLIRFPAGAQLFMSLGNPSPCRPNLLCVVYWGPTGFGKSRAAFSGGDDSTFAPTLPLDPRQPTWFDGYVSQPHLVLDEFCGQIAFRNLLRILDVNSWSPPAKGRMLQAHWTKVTITSNTAPNTWYPNEDYAPLRRRLHGIYTEPPWDLGVLPY